MLKKKTLLVALALTSQPTFADLLISEYVEGSSYNKAVEISNTGTTEENLDGVALAVYFNGASTTTARVPLSGTLAPGASLVLAHASASADIKADIRSGTINFNGDDALALERNGVALDKVGIIGVDPGSEFTAPGKSTKDMTLRRLPGSPAGDFDFSQWQAFAKDSFGGLGCTGLSDCGADSEPPTAWQCPQEWQSIPSIQGPGASSPLVPAGSYQSSDPVVTQGRVTQVVSGLFKGFFLQDGAGDGDPATSDGIFVFTGKAPDPSIKPGMALCVEGLVKEYYGLTEIAMDHFAQSPLDLAPVQPVDLEVGDDVPASLERVEGMEVRLTQDSDMQVTRPFSYDYAASRNNMMLAHGGPLLMPTQLYPALSDDAKALAAANQARSLYIDTDNKPADGVIPYFPGLDAEQGYIRVGDRVQNLEGVMTYSYGNYRLLAGNQVGAGDFVHLDDRTSAPVLAADGQVRIASFNVLNYFNEAVGGGTNPLGVNRGAKTAADFALQQAKIVHALLAIDADILGLLEVENNGFGDDSAIQSLVTALNAELPQDKQYAIIKPAQDGFVGSDAIMAAMIYRPAKVAPQGEVQLLEMPNQITLNADGSENIHHGGRPSLLQRFKRVYEGQAEGESFQFALNHLRSKGSSCAEDEEGKADDGQGSCNELRNSEVALIADKIEASATPTLMLGDFNAYGNEDPLLVLTQIPALDRELKTAHDTYLGDNTQAPQLDGPARVISKGYGFVKLAEDHAYSYQYGGMVGRLDQALATPDLATKVAAITDWHINAAESNLFTYSSQYTGALVKSDGPFSSSDHDPVVVSLNWPLKGKLSAEQDSLTLFESQGPAGLVIKREGGADGELGLTAELRFLGKSRHGHHYADSRDISLPQPQLRFADGEDGEKALVLDVKADRPMEQPEKLELVLHFDDGHDQVIPVTIVDDTRPVPAWLIFLKWLKAQLFG
ncbi:ExeM/NucH family extracellular endonuclease [Gallaecimonas kandeliae]|uniref:ExeM/NucH family extracellular endonuclease n=1 Tax=Gallaecimonas kandeliae TaxID=3029055 RepID=UPI002649EBEB|nr:ExeM/NucH family extracellular endonuclease [Gallaecimonas kandeliae]WKE66691.1 ExeM/NucH family extracellular endonuclease [Gallaecimonas kandeliae]